MKVDDKLMLENKIQTEEKLDQIIENQKIINLKLDLLIQLIQQQGGVDNLQLFLQTLSLADLTGLQRR